MSLSGTSGIETMKRLQSNVRLLSMPSLSLSKVYACQSSSREDLCARNWVVQCFEPFTFWNVGNTWHGKPLKDCHASTLKLGVKKLLQMLKLPKHAGREYVAIGAKYSWMEHIVQDISRSKILVSSQVKIVATSGRHAAHVRSPEQPELRSLKFYRLAFFYKFIPCCMCKHVQTYLDLVQILFVFCSSITWRGSCQSFARYFLIHNGLVWIHLEQSNFLHSKGIKFSSVGIIWLCPLSFW